MVDQISYRDSDLSMATDLPLLPSDVVVNIQSFMNYRDTTRSACLCAALYESWYKRTEIDFDEGQFTNPSECWLVAGETVNRYIDEELEMNMFRVRMVSQTDPTHSSATVIEAAAKIAAEIFIVLADPTITYRIPNGVFDSTKLVGLTVVGGSLDLSQKLPVSCASIRSMTLYPLCNVGIGNDILNNYVLHFPNLERLFCRGFLLRFDCSSIFSVVHDLRELGVDRVTVEDHFWLKQFIPRFHRLRKVSIRDLPSACRHLLLYSQSVEHISIEDRIRSVAATLNMPRLRTFTFDGHPASRFTFNSAIDGVVFKIILRPRELSAKWLGDLHSFLLGLSSSSHIILEVKHHRAQTIPCLGADIALYPVAVDILEVSHLSMNPSFVDVLLRVCNPRETRYTSA